jgi:hypothetical protein
LQSQVEQRPLPTGFGFLQGDPRHASQLFGIALAGYVHVKGRWTGAEQVVVHGRHLQTLREQLRDHRIDLSLGQNEIAHHHRCVAHRFERDPAAQGKAWLELDAVKADLEIGSGESIAVNRAAYRCGAAKCEIDFLPVRFGRCRVRCAQQRKGHQWHHGTHVGSP